MKRSTYKKLFKHFFVLFLVPNLYGMNCGVVGHCTNQCSHIETAGDRAFVAITKNALGIEDIRSPEEAVGIMDQLFKAFIIRREKDESMKTKLGGKNLAFYNGEAYINGLIPTIYGYDNLYLTNDKRVPYHVKQLYEVMGFDKTEAKKIEYVTRIRNNFNLLVQSAGEFYIRSFWNDVKGKTYSQINASQREQLKKYKNLSHEYGEYECMREYERIKATADYIKSLHGLGIDTENLELSKNLQSRLTTLHKSYSEATKRAQDVLKKYLEEFGRYIAYFNIEDSVDFLTEMHQLSQSKAALDYWLSAASESKYNRYTHTEYMIRYQHHNKSTPLCIVSLNDVCKNCEKMLAETTLQESWKYNTIVVSAQEYANSRTRERLDDQTNFSLLLLQLHPKYFFPENRYSPAEIESENREFNFQLPNIPAKTAIVPDFTFGNTFSTTPSGTPMSSFGPDFGLGSKSVQNFGFSFEIQPTTSFGASAGDYNATTENEDMMDTD